jgi:hypothetical protein
MEKFIEKIDLLGTQNKLKLKGRDTYKSVSGGIMTIFLLILITLSFVAFGRDIFEKRNPSSTYSKGEAESPYFEFNDTNTFMFGFIDLNSQPVAEIDRKFRIYLEQHDNSPERAASGGKFNIKTIIPLVKCTEDRITPKIKGLMNLPLSSYYCLEKGARAILDGVYPVGTEKHIRLQVDLCTEKSTGRNDCYPDSYIRNMGRFKMHYILPNTFIDNGNYYEPGQPKLFSDEFVTNGVTFGRQHFWFKNVEYNTDVGWILEDIRQQNYTAIERIDNIYIPDSNTSTVFSMQYFMIGLKDTYKRGYIKIQGVFAYIGGFITFFKLFLTNFNNYFVFPEYVSLFFNSYNKAKTIRNDVNLIKLKELKNNYVNDLSNDSGWAIATISNISRKEMFGKLTICEKLMRSCCFKSNQLRGKINMLKSIVKLFNKKISIENIGKLSRELKLLKYILFDDDQKYLLQYVNIPDNSGVKKNFDECLAEIKKDKPHYQNMVSNRILSYLDAKKSLS